MKEAIETRMEVDGSGEIMKLGRYCPWKDHLYELEDELNVQPKLKFCIYEVSIPLPNIIHLALGLQAPSTSSMCS